MVLSHLISYCFVLGSMLFCSSLSNKMSHVPLIGIFVYRFVMPRDANLKWGETEVCLSLSIRSLVFPILFVLGRGESCLIFCENILARLYAGAFLQLTMGLMG